MYICCFFLLTTNCKDKSTKTDQADIHLLLGYSLLQNVTHLALSGAQPELLSTPFRLCKPLNVFLSFFQIMNLQKFGVTKQLFC